MKHNISARHSFLIIVFAVLFLGLVIVLIESLPYHDIRNWDFTNVVSIKIEDRGLLGNNIVEIRNPVTIKRICLVIKQSNKISDGISKLKLNKGLCDMYLINKDMTYKSFSIVNGNSNRGLITSGQFVYKNDSLLSIALNSVRSEYPDR